jgi:cytochrome P450
MNEIRSESKLKSCRYLRAYLNKILRTSSFVSFDLFREVFSSDIEMNEIMMLEDTFVDICIYVFYHNQSVFSNSFTYRFER